MAAHGWMPVSNVPLLQIYSTLGDSPKNLSRYMCTLLIKLYAGSFESEAYIANTSKIGASNAGADFVVSDSDSVSSAIRYNLLMLMTN